MRRQQSSAKANRKKFISRTLRKIGYVSNGPRVFRANVVGGERGRVRAWPRTTLIHCDCVGSRFNDRRDTLTRRDQTRACTRAHATHVRRASQFTSRPNESRALRLTHGHHVLAAHSIALLLMYVAALTPINLSGEFRVPCIYMRRIFIGHED